MATDNRGRRADAIARDHVADAISTVVEVMNDPLSEVKDRLKAAEMIIERGEGKVAQAIIAIPGTKRMAEQYAAMTDDALMDLIRAEPLPRLAAPAVEAEFEDIDPLLL